MHNSWRIILVESGRFILLNILILFSSLLATWFVLSGFFTPFFIAVGLFSCLLSVIISLKINKGQKNLGSLFGMILRFPYYFGWLIVEIVKASFDVATRMWQLEPDISPEIGWVPTKLKSDLALTVLGNSITLTPGTVTAGVRDDGMVQVHALTKIGMRDVRKGTMADKVAAVVWE